MLLRQTGHANVFWFVFAWGAAAAVAAAVGPLQARVVPRLSGAWEWVSRHRDLGPRYLAEGTANSASSQLRNYGVGFILGLAAVGYVQAATTLMGPFMVIFFGMGLVTLPEAARILRRSPRHLPLFCLLVSAGLPCWALAWGVVLLVALPRGLGHLMLGSLWRPTYPLVLPTTIGIMGGCAGPAPARACTLWAPRGGACAPWSWGQRWLSSSASRAPPPGGAVGTMIGCGGSVLDGRAAVLVAIPHGATRIRRHTN